MFYFHAHFKLLRIDTDALYNLLSLQRAAEILSKHKFITLLIYFPAVSILLFTASNAAFYFTNSKLGLVY